jgi:hypothetical protein
MRPTLLRRVASVSSRASFAASRINSAARFSAPIESESTSVGEMVQWRERRAIAWQSQPMAAAVLRPHATHDLTCDHSVLVGCELAAELIGQPRATILRIASSMPQTVATATSNSTAAMPARDRYRSSSRSLA